MPASPLSIGQCATLSTLLEASVPKPGNVHRGADFENLTFYDFAASAVAIAPALEAAPHTRLGTTVLEAIRATRRVVATNTNLGTVLLLAPLATVPRDEPLATGIGRVLAGLDADDARLVYEAIRLAEPGGLGHVDEADITGQPPRDLLAAMRLAAERDLVARQYANHFEQILGEVVPWLAAGLEAGWKLPVVIIYTQLQLLAAYPDSLIARKCGAATAREAAARAGAVLDAGPPEGEAYRHALGELDFWLRGDHHRRNPGTTADLIAAGLFAVLRDGIITGPFPFSTR